MLTSEQKAKQYRHINSTYCTAGCPVSNRARKQSQNSHAGWVRPKKNWRSYWRIRCANMENMGTRRSS